MKPLLIAHRGDAANFPENTLEAFESAFVKGADGVEMDVQIHNNELVLVHNYLFDRSKRYPRLKDVLKKFAGKGRLEIELKSLDLEFLEPLKVLLAEYKSANIELTTSVIPLVSYVRPVFDDIPIGVIFQTKEFEDWMTAEFISTKILKIMQLLKGNIAHVSRASVIDQQLVDTLHKHNIKIHSHIPHQPKASRLALYKTFRALGVDQCTFDDIDLINEAASL